MEQGSKVYAILNTLMLTDITKWDTEYLDTLIEKINNFVDISTIADNQLA
jgi:hypothetical protein